ncbi:MAG: hypothetical protein WC503_06700 [Candidatus Shapirobacteria bacterium]
MLPKPEKNSKRSSTEQLDLVETIDEVDKTKKKRLSIIVFLLLTVGVSLCFVAYRQFKNVNLKDIKFPQISFKIPDQFQSKFSPIVPENWSIWVQTVGTSKFIFQSNLISPPNLKELKNPNNPSYAKKYLPDGVIVIERTNLITDYLEVVSQIQTPKTNFEIYTKIPGKISQNSPELDIFSKLVETFYWHLLK